VVSPAEVGPAAVVRVDPVAAAALAPERAEAPVSEYIDPAT
jgi:hypothetical protein